MPNLPSFSMCSPTVAGAMALAIAAMAALAPAQAVVYTSRNGGNLASCGPLGGPSAHHTFLSTTATNDNLAVMDPGGTTGSITWSSSAADAQMTASATTSGISLSVAGSVTRGPLPGLGLWTFADGRDDWVLTITAPTRFTLNASLSTASTEATVPMSHFTFAGFGLVPDPGSPPPPYQHTLVAPGSFAVAASGTLMPGTYIARLFGRAEGTTYPFTASYSNSLVVTFQPAATATARQALGNPNSYTCGVPLLGQTWNASVDVGATGQGFAIVFASLAPAQLPLAPGLTMLVGGSVLEFLPLAAGPVANYTFSMPGNGALAGFQLFTQALHLGGTPSLLFSNAQDLTLGF